MLGAGTFGEVYITKDNISVQKIAVKVEDNRTQQHIVHKCAIENLTVLI